MSDLESPKNEHSTVLLITAIVLIVLCSMDRSLELSMHICAIRVIDVQHELTCAATTSEVMTMLWDRNLYIIVIINFVWLR